MTKQKQYKYLIGLYSKINLYLSESDPLIESLPEIIISFCTFTERILKIKLHQKNPLLIFDPIENTDRLIAAVKGIEKNIPTISFDLTIERYTSIFEDFNNIEAVAINSIYGIRNQLIHSYKSDEQILSIDTSGLIKKMGTIWKDITKVAKSVLGNQLKSQTPQNIYTEKELENIIANEIQKKIDAKSQYRSKTQISSNFVFSTYSRGDKCPACEEYGFKKDDPIGSDLALRATFIFGKHISEIYVCSNCHLELTQKEYDIAISKGIIKRY